MEAETLGSELDRKLTLVSKMRAINRVIFPSSTQRQEGVWRLPGKPNKFFTLTLDEDE
jgi:hypothetical protein